MPPLPQRSLINFCDVIATVILSKYLSAILEKPSCHPILRKKNLTGFLRFQEYIIFSTLTAMLFTLAKRSISKKELPDILQGMHANGADQRSGMKYIISPTS